MIITVINILVTSLPLSFPLVLTNLIVRFCKWTLKRRYGDVTSAYIYEHERLHPSIYSIDNFYSAPIQVAITECPEWVVPNFMGIYSATSTSKTTKCSHILNGSILAQANFLSYSHLNGRILLEKGMLNRLALCEYVLLGVLSFP